MKVIIPRVPKTTTKRDLFRLAVEELRHRFQFPFTNPPQVTDCEVIQIKDSRGTTEHHGVISIDSSAAGRWLIQRVQGKRLHNKMVFARQFMNRKANGVVFHPLYERRRGDLEIVKADLPYSLHDGIEVTTIAYPYSS